MSPRHTQGGSLASVPSKGSHRRNELQAKAHGNMGRHCMVRISTKEFQFPCSRPESIVALWELLYDDARLGHGRSRRCPYTQRASG